MACIVVLLVWGLSRAFVASSTRAEAAAAVEVRLAEALADSAVAEMEAQVGNQANNLRGPLAGLLRRQILGNESGDLDLMPFLHLAELGTLRATQTYRGFSVDSTSARVVFQRPIDTVPYEKRGLVLFTATVSSPGLVRRATRRVEVARWLKTTLTVAPRPFGNNGLFLVNAGGLTDMDAVNRFRDRAAELCRMVRTTLRGLATGASGPSPQSCQEVLRQAFDPDAPKAMPDPLKPLEGTAVYGLQESGATQSLRDLDLAVLLSDLIQKAERAQARFGVLAASPATDPTIVLQAARVASSAAVAPLRELWAFEHTYAILAPDNVTAWRELKPWLYKLTADYFARRAHYLLREEAGHRDLSDALRKLLDRPVHGVVDVQNTSAPVNLTGPVTGRAILLIGPGGATVHDLNPAPSSTGLMTLVVSGGPVRITGKNGVTLVIVEPPSGGGGTPPIQLTIAPDAHIHGSLIATSVPAGSRLDGELERDERVFSGLTSMHGEDQGMYDRYFVGLSPRIHYRRVVRP